MTVDTNNLIYLPILPSTNCDLQFAINDMQTYLMKIRVFTKQQHTLGDSHTFTIFRECDNVPHVQLIGPIKKIPGTNMKHFTTVH